MKELSKELRAGVRTWIEIDTEAVAHNYTFFRSIIGAECKFMSVVKSNAYGHGLVDFSRTVSQLGVDWLGVDSVVEGLRLRKEGITKPILVLGFTLPEVMKLAQENDISVSLSHMEHLHTAALFGLPLKVHIKVDTGMHRQGFLKEQIQEVISFLKEHPNIIAQGLFTHFASAKNPDYPDFVEGQMKEFTLWREAFKDAGFTPIVHASATGAAMLYKKYHFNMIRIGMSMYGAWPALEVENKLKTELTLKPILSWRTIISEIKKIPAGEKIGYDSTEVVTRDTMMAVCPVGYWHGITRLLSGKAHFAVREKKVKILGRVSMDMIVIDVTDVPNATIYDVVTLVGRDGDVEIRAEDHAALSQTSVYEFLTRLNPLIKKFYL